MRLNEHRKVYRKGDLSSKRVMHFLETVHMPDFDNLQILALNFANYISRIFLEGWFTGLENFALNHACVVLPEYTVFL